MSPPRPTELLHTLLAQTIQPGDTVIDATCGNGHDTLFLAHSVGPSGHVIAIDIQQPAIESTHQKLLENNLLHRVSLHQKSHQHIADFAPPDSVSAITFNLGYLPGSDHSLITSPQSTLNALTSSISLLKPNGTLAVICYPGHPGGDSESTATEKFITNQINLRTAKYSILATKKPAPFLLIATKSSTPSKHSILPHATSALLYEQ